MRAEMTRTYRGIKSSWRRRRTALRVGAAILLLQSLSAGCVPFAAAVANMTGGDWIEPEFELSQEPLLVLIDDPNGLVTEPRAIREAYLTISEIFLEFKVNKMIVPFQEWQRLRADPKYASYSVRQIGEKLGARQVLHVGVERFTLHAEAGAPIFKGQFAARVKVLSTERQKDVRLWPEGESGRRLEVETTPTPSDGEVTAADVAKELGIKMGQEVAKLFYGRREFDS